MRGSVVSALAIVLTVSAVQARQAPDYAAFWETATPYPKLRANVNARRHDWWRQFENAAVEAGPMPEERARPGRRRNLAVANDRCSESDWARPCIAKLVAVVPEKLELRVIHP